MTENEEISDEVFWKNKIQKHWKVFLIAIIGAVCLFIGSIIVLIWFIETSPIGYQGSATFDQWKLDWVVGFIILIILWELLFIGVPAGLFYGIGGYLWWRGLPEEEKQEFKARDKKDKAYKAGKYGGGGGGFGIFMFIAYCFYIGMDGNYHTQFGDRSYSYWLYSYMLTFIWVIIILGVPIGIICLILYFTKWRKK
ncbi:MAG: hypothetical protein ACFFA0_10280 [Promethearchaeota archaeon]